ncbi:ArdC family protein [Pengzhenrongella sicca]|uniref:N-terminal domain-containing protein n=1 Tax=Pengzhenrongella sicca TaxID=2819238 RepID=A0A8A4ZDK1_9MICO|nr:ArdC family protein [Pengzhenrongella sicca]QTE30060.1 hypothetical protein J4E96_03280 [Pengzhenrongella sicca]
MVARRGDWPTPEEKLNALHAKLVAAVEELASSDAWHRMLVVAARFPTYSPSNILLIATQRPDATRVAGFRTWSNLGRHVNKGEHGIAILAPCLYRGDPDDARADTDAAAKPAAPPDAAAAAKPGPVERRHLRGFRVVHVFDLSQTDGEPLPDVAPELLRGEPPAELWDHLELLIKEDGYAVERGECAGANGYTDYTTRTVRVLDDVDPLQATKTLIHEAAHIRAGHQERFPTYRSSLRCRGIAEVEAESIAYLVSGLAGLDSTAYSVPYIADWSGGDSTVLNDTAARVLSVARTMGELLVPRALQVRGAVSERLAPRVGRNLAVASKRVESTDSIFLN